MLAFSKEDIPDITSLFDKGDLILISLSDKNLIITDDLSMKSLKYSLAENTKRAFEAGCNLALHCNGNIKEMTVIAENSPKVNSFIIKKTSEFYNNLS